MSPRRHDPRRPPGPDASRAPAGRWPSVLLAAAVGVAVLPGLLGGGADASTGAPPGGSPDRGAEHAVVRPGETLWGVAVEHTRGDPRAYVQRLRELNGLGDGPVPAWTVVRLPPP